MLSDFATAFDTIGSVVATTVGSYQQADGPKSHLCFCQNFGRKEKVEWQNVMCPVDCIK